MGFFKKKKDETSHRDLSRLHGKGLSYAVERTGGQELVLGRKGGISVTEAEIIVVCDGHEVFRCNARGAVAAELMSHNGVDIKGADPLTGEKRHIIAYYSNLKQ
ncbi:hypothetical protein [Ruminococcus sp. Marseille-P6503]|uniref:hypothetical protein n=1 Tax=Ruminococcus sp. Marseille-P6503 TaxID=2364796 RepID=UPI000F5298F1|nr:hypothetical protein [Ruminococcus sp. Marseille-P6503]